MSIRVTRFAAPILLLALFAVAAPQVRAHGPSIAVPELGQARKLAGGLLEVTLRTGAPLLTHGADGPQTLAPLASGNERPVLCTASMHQHVLYGRPAGAPDRSASARPVIESAIFGMNAELDRAAMESGGRHADYRFRCDASGELTIGSFVNLFSTSFADIVDAARLSGALDPNVDYTIFYDDPSPEACGTGSFTPDSSPGADNANNKGGGYAVVYADCWNPATVMHESGHNQGAVQPGSPNASGGKGHCRDEADVMCYADSPSVSTVLLCSGGEVFDCGYDDYFDAAPEVGEYLQAHWNLGSAANRFITLSGIVEGEGQPVRTCRRDADMPLAVDTVACTDAAAEEETETEEVLDEAELEPVRILAVRYHPRRGRVQVRLACPAPRATACRGRLTVADARARARSFHVTPDETAVVRLALSQRTRRAWSAGRRRRVRVIATEAGATAEVSRALRVGGTGR